MAKMYSQKTIEKIERKVMLAKSKKNPTIFLVERIALTLAVFLVVNAFSLIWLALSISFIFYVFYENIFLDKLIEKRIQKLDQEGLYFFEVLMLSLESGNNLENSIELVSKSIESELSTEFKKVINEMKFGKTLPEALAAMQKRIPSEGVNNILLSISNTSSLGTKLNEILKNQIDFLRKKNFLTLKEEINKIPVKISIVSVLMILPLILLLILGPLLVGLITWCIIL